jgi:hypothetical protein
VPAGLLHDQVPVPHLRSKYLIQEWISSRRLIAGGLSSLSMRGISFAGMDLSGTQFYAFNVRVIPSSKGSSFTSYNAEAVAVDLRDAVF